MSHSPWANNPALAAAIAGTLSPTQGGTGVANAAGSTITLGGPLAMSGAFASMLTVTGITTVTLPTSGTLATTAQLPAGANPTASVGTSAVNGAAATFMRSDAAPALSVTISPTWTGVHTFQPSSGVKLHDAQITSAGAAVYARIANGSGAAGSIVVLCLDATSNGFNSRDCQVRATTDGANAVTMSFWTANGAAPGNRLEISPAGQLKVMTVGRGISISEGANAKMGVATMVAGAVTVNTTVVTANSRIMLTPQNASGGAGSVSITARTAGTSFAIGSTNVLDTRDVAWIIFEPS